MFCRLIKPQWAVKDLKDGPNPSFVKEIPGPSILEGLFTDDYISAKNAEGYNVYFFPNHPSTNIYGPEKKHLSGKDIEVFNCIFVDMDLKDEIYKSKEEFYETLAMFPLKPTKTVDSGNGVHAYWKFTDLTRDIYLLGQLGLIRDFKTDVSVWSVLQLMRIPGSINTKKHDNFKRSAIIPHLTSEKVYSVSDIPEQLLDLSPELMTKARSHIDRLEGRISLNLDRDLDLNELPDKFIDLLMTRENIYQLYKNPKQFYGDRSAADMSLANILYNEGYTHNQALQVIANSEKAIEKGPSRYEYASLTVWKVFTESPVNKFMSAYDRLQSPRAFDEAMLIRGPQYFDCLEHKWRTREVLGLIGGTGVGKTQCCLNIMRDIVINNLDTDGIFVIISLEMSEKEILDRWAEFVGYDENLMKRLYVIDTEDDDQNPRTIGLQEIYQYVTDIKNVTQKEVLAVMIDHKDEISRQINVKVMPNFGVLGQQNTGYGDVRAITPNFLCQQFKPLAKMLNTFLIVLTQTTKAKGVGDIPINKDGAYGVSEYEKVLDYLLTIWQPILRVQHLTEHHYLAWQYAKIRHKSSKDPVTESQKRVLYFEMDSGEYRYLKDVEKEPFSMLVEQAYEDRQKEEKKKVISYNYSADLQKLDQLVKKRVCEKV